MSGGRALLIDTGMSGDPPGVVPDVSRDQIARSAGTTAAEVS